MKRPPGRPRWVSFVILTVCWLVASAFVPPILNAMLPGWDGKTHDIEFWADVESRLLPSTIIALVVATVTLIERGGKK